MATVSPHFNHYFATNEQNLIQDLVEESIYMRGLEVYYIKKTQDNIDFLFKEDPTKYYTEFKKIAMWPAFVSGFDGEEMMAMFGNEFKKSATFVVGRRNFETTFPELPTPNEGDLIFMPVTNAILEIKHVVDDSVFFEKGNLYVYDLKCEMFEYSYEDINVDDPVLESYVDDIIVENHDVEVEPYGFNDDIEDATEDEIDFDPSNPFGVL